MECGRPSGFGRRDEMVDLPEMPFKGSRVETVVRRARRMGAEEGRRRMIVPRVHVGVEPE
jgi:hypothetical protein